MNKSELIEVIAKEASMSKKDAEAAVNAYNKAVTDALKKGDKVTLVGFGTYEVRERAAHEGKNPRTGETLRIPAAKVPAFKPGKTLKDALNG